MASGTRRADVVVLGGGVAGLAASLAFARRGRAVTLLERDAAPAGDGADALFDRWERPGVAHFRQPHQFLALARCLLLAQMPDVVSAIVGEGALENRQYERMPGGWQPADEDLVSICARRPLFEAVLRRAVEAEPNIRMEPGTSVLGLLTREAPGNGPVRVVGVKTDRGELASDLVVDALGRSSPITSWLKPLSVGPPFERTGDCGVFYYSRHFRFRPGVEMPRVTVLLGGPRGELPYMAFQVVVEDNRTVALVLTIPPWERDLRVLRFEHQYMATALAMPPLVPWVHPDQSDPITPVLPFGRLQNLQRSLVVDGEPVVVGLQSIGDALCHTNPTFAFGASLAVKHALALAEIAGRTEDPREIALGFDEAVGSDAAARFDAVAGEDRDRIRLWGGEPIDVRDPGQSMALFLRMTVYPAAGKDPALFRAVARRVNLLDPPDALQRNGALMERARELGNGAEPPLPPGPPRSALLELLSQVG